MSGRIKDVNTYSHLPDGGRRTKRTGGVTAVPTGIAAFLAAVFFLWGGICFGEMTLIRAYAAGLESGGTEQTVSAEPGVTGAESAGQISTVGGTREASADPVEMDIEYGYDNVAKGGRYLPFKVTITNHEEQALDGSLRIKTTESDGTVYQYEYEVWVDAVSAGSFLYYIPLGTNTDQLFVTLADGAGTTVLNKRVRINASMDVPELFIGILSDESWNLSYLNGIGIHYSTLRSRTFELTEEDISEDQVSLSLLDVLVVNNYKLRNLSEAQTAAIMDWVGSGGILILGTGDRVDDTLGRFAPELLDDSYGTPDLTSINLGENLDLEEPGGGSMEIFCVDIPLHGGNVIISSGGFPLLTAATREQGLIAVAAFDLGDISEFCQRHTSYVDYLFTSLMGESRINQLSQVAYSGNTGKFWSVQSLINTGNLDKLPKLGMYVCVVFAYLLLLGPGLYIFLKQRSLQIYYRRAVLGLSLIFTVLIYLMGTRTRFQSTFYTYASVRDVTDDYVKDTTYVNIRNPYNRPYEVKLNPQYSVLPITRDSGSGTERAALSEEEPYQMAIQRKEDGVTLLGQNITAFAPRYFQLEQKYENTEKIGITAEVDYFEGRISGTITNQFDFPLEDATLFLYGNMVQLGRMEPGETRNLEDCVLLRFPLGNFYVVANYVTGEMEFDGTDIRDEEYLLTMERANLLKFYLDNYMTGYTADARLIAFSTEKEESRFLQTPSSETYGLTMLTAAVEVNASRDRSIYRSVLMKTPRVISGSYDEAANAMNGSEPLTLEYDLGTDIDVESLTFETVSEEFMENSGNFTEIFTGNVYFYNYSTGNYDPVDWQSVTLEAKELFFYISPANTMNVRYVYDGVGGYGSVQLPMPMAAGRER